MKIYVTENDIRIASDSRNDNNKEYRANRDCPIAQSFRRRGHHNVKVEGTDFTSISPTGMRKIYYLPDVAQEFIRDFDREQIVLPFRFTATLSAYPGQYQTYKN